MPNRPPSGISSEPPAVDRVYPPAALGSAVPPPSTPPPLPTPAATAGQPQLDHPLPVPVKSMPQPISDSAKLTGESTSPKAEPEDEPSLDEGASSLDSWISAAPCWLASLVFHLVLMVVLALCALSDFAAKKEIITMRGAEDVKDMSENDDVILDKEIDIDTEQLPKEMPEQVIVMNPNVDVPDPTHVLLPSNVRINFDEQVFWGATSTDLHSSFQGISAEAYNNFGQRIGSGRMAASRRGGGDMNSEGAVNAALSWLVEHQQRDGSWSFIHNKGPCKGRCPNPGNMKTRMGPTGLALMVFLGHGETHKQGALKKIVESGLNYLLKHMTVKKDRARLYEKNAEDNGHMYCHGISTIALCEAYAMTHDRQLGQVAQQAINYIAWAQHEGGGWRYEPKQKGDTSVVGWQIMALKSASMAYLKIPKETIKKAKRYLDSVQRDSGAHYGYENNDDRDKAGATTAIGLLCRMYLGWRRDHAGLQGGIMTLSNKGPTKGNETNMYYNYYATLVQRMYGGDTGPQWRKWNPVMRDYLVNTQSGSGHSKGSWFFDSGHSGSGGRHYCTTMAAMTLMVYYRYQPIYTFRSVDDDFPLD